MDVVFEDPTVRDFLAQYSYKTWPSVLKYLILHSVQYIRAQYGVDAPLSISALKRLASSSRHVQGLKDLKSIQSELHQLDKKMQRALRHVNVRERHHEARLRNHKSVADELSKPLYSRNLPGHQSIIPHDSVQRENSRQTNSNFEASLPLFPQNSTKAEFKPLVLACDPPKVKKRLENKENQKKLNESRGVFDIEIDLMNSNKLAKDKSGTTKRLKSISQTSNERYQDWLLASTIKDESVLNQRECSKQQKDRSSPQRHISSLLANMESSDAWKLDKFSSLCEGKPQKVCNHFL